ncbi:MAG: hypothetical protein KJO50_01595 [Bacteroidia bacterium]|nr:hypothetical protein [Bacteroidia bacterium]NNK89367.1 hypothetical protein [Saprospiraceae bacterium]
MSALIRLIVLFFVFVGSMGYIVYHVSTFFLSLGSRKKLLQRDFKQLHSLIAEYKDGLIPLDFEELKLLSSSPISKIKRRGVYTTSKGYLSTIYQEPLFAFGIKKYKKTGRAVMLVESDKHEYKFYFDRKKTSVFKDKQLKAYITDDDKLVSIDQVENARIETISGQKYATIYEGGDDLAHLNLKDVDGSAISDRAFSVFHDVRENSMDKLIYLGLYHLLLKPNLSA